MDKKLHTHYRHLFGPVMSRRLGRSLGIDCVPHKTCTLNCVYCECGPTTLLTMRRREYVPAAAIIAELDDMLGKSPILDVVTFAGSGEPTLHSRLGEIVAHVRAKYPGCTTALLTNGTLLHLKNVRDEIGPFDYVLPTLDAVSQDVFEKIHRPAAGVTASRIIAGLRDFAAGYRGRLWIEVFIVPGINDTGWELGLLKETLQTIRLDRVQLNTLDRPGACDWVKPATPERLREIADFLRPLPVEIIARGAPPVPSQEIAGGVDIGPKIIAALKRRPCTVDDLAAMCGKKRVEIQKALASLESAGTVVVERVGGFTFYKISAA